MPRPITPVIRTDRTDREALVALMTALAESVGPLVFAGFGGDIARYRYALGSPTTVEGMAAQDAEIGGLISRWADAIDAEQVLQVLVSILTATGPVGAEADLRRADRVGFEYALVTLLVHVGARAPATFDALLGPIARGVSEGAELARQALDAAREARCQGAGS